MRRGKGKGAESWRWPKGTAYFPVPLLRCGRSLISSHFAAFRMSVARRRAVVFAGALALRILLIVLFPSLPDLLTGRVEVSTPVNSFKRRELDCLPMQDH